MSSFTMEKAATKVSLLVVKGFLNKFGEIFVEKGGDRLITGDGITAVQVMQPVQVAGGPLEVAGTLDARVVMTTPLKVDILSVSTTIAVGVFGGWLIVKVAWCRHSFRVEMAGMRAQNFDGLGLSTK